MLYGYYVIQSSNNNKTAKTILKKIVVADEIGRENEMILSKIGLGNELRKFFAKIVADEENGGQGNELKKLAKIVVA